MKQKWMFFWNCITFSMIQLMLAIWFLIPLPFLNSACTSRSSQFMYCWSLAWRILSILLLTCEMRTIVQYLVWTFFDIALWGWKENWPFPVCTFEVYCRKPEFWKNFTLISFSKGSSQPSPPLWRVICIAQSPLFEYGYHPKTPSQKYPE